MASAPQPNTSAIATIAPRQPVEKFVIEIPPQLEPV
jgi:hypothetical protein